MDAGERLEMFARAVATTEPKLGRLVSYAQEEDAIRLDYQGGVVRYNLDLSEQLSIELS